MDEMSLDEILKRVNMTPAELAGKLAWHIKKYEFDEDTQIVAVHNELKKKMKPSRSL